ncbi:alkylation response protein AidB-like acyl-CoA dehydrogenase [Variovorax sp. GrIS 2.14]|uniref:acyl-CoA dehydrogenase family protein n=1 Tax=Variovorax sp. GrIS 2.14 TaxID=3071709 RepID=UPI0019854E53|nr:acyl-CoA dehydrogenase family protein [Rhodoferax sp.]
MKNKIWADETDAALDDAATRYLAERYRFEVRQLMTRDARRFNSTVWKDLADMGWLSVASSEAHGGLGLRVASICLLAEAAGRSLVTEPLTSSGVLATHLIASHGSDAQRDARLPRLHAGELIVACVMSEHAVRVEAGLLHGHQDVVIDADIAEQLLVRSGNTLWLLDANAPGVTRQTYPLLDGRGGATVSFDAAQATPLGGTEPTDLQYALWLAALATAADSHGAMSAAFDLTLDYLKTRRQFGHPLGTYQALQHRAVDMYVALGESRAVLDQAIESLQAGAPDAGRDVHAAKALVSESARRVTQEAVQLHGGIGVTEEYAASHYLRRARVNEQLWGSAEQHFMAFAASAPATI